MTINGVLVRGPAGPAGHPPDSRPPSRPPGPPPPPVPIPPLEPRPLRKVFCWRENGMPHMADVVVRQHEPVRVFAAVWSR